MLWGIDVSHHQGDAFDFAAARAAGIEFAILKATEGGTWIDPQFRRNLAAARSAGMLVAAYHYQRHGVPLADRIANITRTVPRDVPVIVDLEDGGGHTDQTRATLDRLRELGYSSPLLYLPRWYWEQIGRPDLRGLPPLWASRCPDNNGGTPAEIYRRVPARFWDAYGGNRVDVLQFSSSATVGRHRPVDVNAYQGSRAELAALLGARPPAPLPGGIEDMALDTQFRDSFGNVQTVESFMSEVMRKLNDLHYPAVVPGSVPSRIPGDTNTTTVFDMVKDATAWTNQILGRVIAIQAASSTDPAAVAEALRPVVADVVGPVIRDALRDVLGADAADQADAIVDAIAARLSTPTPQE
ncbi:glycoside hydrolase family 25 protein [Saccharopolyspora hattusasensis]|uniref:glycoside hydrolase family 25 protein n=1 Tax=Saccharopolyspora hattusasensis TaxID=1128679 RepID=UPI003D965ADE